MPAESVDRASEKGGRSSCQNLKGNTISVAVNNKNKGCGVSPVQTLSRVFLQMEICRNDREFERRAALTGG